MFSEEPKKQTEDTENIYAFRWNYADQKAFEADDTKKKKKHGLLGAIIVMVSAFLACFLLLLGALIWNGTGKASARDGVATEVADEVLPSVVLIYASGNGTQGYGTGFFVRSDGYIVTNYHVVEQAKTVRVTMYSGDVRDATVVGYSAFDDLAILKIAGSNYPAVRVGDSSRVRVGEVAVAIGNPGGTEAAWTTTQGIVSALNRTVTVNEYDEIYEMTMLQTDAPVNTGNSGGPLCNADGEVIGIVTRKLSGYESLGFALPISGSMEIVNAIIAHGHANDVDSAITKVRPTIGIQCYDVKKGEEYTYNGNILIAEADGIFVAEVTQGSGADGVLQISDIIVAINGTKVSDSDDLKKALFDFRVGDRIELTVVRNGQEIKLTVTLGRA